MFRIAVLGVGLLLSLCLPAWGGLYYSGETIAPLPSQWRGFLIDQRLLRSVAVKPVGSTLPSPLRARYEKAAEKLEKLGKERPLTAEEQADLGAIHLRLGNLPRALAVLRAGHKEHPQHFHLVANLGTAYQMNGDLPQAAGCLQQAVRLAPAEQKPSEEMHLKLVRLRLRETPEHQELDDLLGIRFVNDRGDYEPGRLAAEQRKKLSASAVAHIQQLALWLPTDGRLLWQLGELAAVYGDLKTGAAIMDGCVTEFGLRARELTRHRQLLRAAVTGQKEGPAVKTMHEGHAGTLKTRSPRPLVDRSIEAGLPAIKPEGINGLPWQVLTQTTVDRHYRPTFSKYLQDLDGKQVRLEGFVQPLGMALDMNAFLLIEYPVGCWYCEIPEIIAMVYIELPPGKTLQFSRDLIQVTGKLKLNAKDPEDFLYSIANAEVKVVE